VLPIMAGLAIYERRIQVAIEMTRSIGEETEMRLLRRRTADGREGWTV